MSLFKRLISPLQTRILEKRMCPACTRRLDKIKRREALTPDIEMVHCLCGRRYIYNRPQRKYRRASGQDLRQVLPNRLTV